MQPVSHLFSFASLLVLACVRARVFVQSMTSLIGALSAEAAAALQQFEASLPPDVEGKNWRALAVCPASAPLDPDADSADLKLARREVRHHPSRLFLDRRPSAGRKSPGEGRHPH